MVLLFAMIRYVVKSVKVPVVEEPIRFRHISSGDKSVVCASEQVLRIVVKLHSPYIDVSWFAQHPMLGFL